MTLSAFNHGNEFKTEMSQKFFINDENPQKSSTFCGFLLFD